MITLAFHHNHQELPPASENLLPVQMYGLSGQRQERKDISVVGNPIVNKIDQLGIRLSEQVMDFLTIALAVTAADTFVSRKDASDGWTRELKIQLPLHAPERWQPLKNDIQSALHFLSGDMWYLDFKSGGYPPPTPKRQPDNLSIRRLRESDIVCLLSGGLDSTIGAIDLLSNGRFPLLVSHIYQGDRKHQDEVFHALKKKPPRFEANADPRFSNIREISMRTRSIIFLALGAVGTYAVQVANNENSVDLVVPENGFISLNAPLTNRRIGTHSTRTTHPHFIHRIQKLFDDTEISCRIVNPYQFKTKGEMVKECKNKNLLCSIVDKTVSCSVWKRKNKQCGVCVPCIVRRAALYSNGIHENSKTYLNNLTDSAVRNNENKRDHLYAFLIALRKFKQNAGPRVIETGPLYEYGEIKDFQKVYDRGLHEIEKFLNAEGIKA